MVGFFHRSLTFEDLEVKGDGKVDTEFGVFFWMLREWDVRGIVLLMTEILRSPVEVGSLSHVYLIIKDRSTSQVFFCTGFLNSRKNPNMGW